MTGRSIKELCLRAGPLLRRLLLSSTGAAWIVILVYFSIGLVGYSLVEPDWSFIDRLYFAVMTTSTVGFGKAPLPPHSCLFQHAGCNAYCPLGWLNTGSRPLRAVLCRLPDAHFVPLTILHLCFRNIKLPTDDALHVADCEARV